MSIKVTTVTVQCPPMAY